MGKHLVDKAYKICRHVSGPDNILITCKELSVMSNKTCKLEFPSQAEWRQGKTWRQRRDFALQNAIRTDCTFVFETDKNKTVNMFCNLLKRCYGSNKGEFKIWHDNKYY